MGVAVVDVVMPAVLVAVPISVAVVALMKEEGEHTQETELGVHVDSHCPLTSGPLENRSNRKVMMKCKCLVLVGMTGEGRSNQVHNISI